MLRWHSFSEKGGGCVADSCAYQSRQYIGYA